MKTMLNIMLLLTFPFLGGSSDNETADFKIQGLEGIYLHLEYTYGLGVEIKYRPYMFFKDGSVFKDLDVSAQDFNPSSSKMNNSDQWGVWKKQGNEIFLNWNSGKSDSWKDGTWYKSVSANMGEQISGSYKSISGVSNVPMGGDATVLSVRNISFKDNLFTYESFTGSSNEGTTVYNNHTKAGTYILDGYSIELLFNNGTREKKFFFFYPDSKDVFGIGSTYYILKD